MSKAWPMVPLGNILRRVERFEVRDELEEYPFAGTYSFARGIFIGERKMGSSFQLPKVQRIRAGDFIYCKIMAWEGAFGIVPKEADGCVMSGAFVAYEPNSERIDSKFLDFFFKVPHHWREIGQQSTGTNVRRRSLHPNQFEASTILLPPLPEQRRIVARIEALAAKVEEARRLRHETVEETEIFLSRANSQILDSLRWEPKRLETVLAEPPRNGLSPQRETESNGRSMLRINAVSSAPSRFVDITAYKTVEVSEDVAAPFVLQHDDVFIVRYNGDINRVAKAAIFKDEGKAEVVYPDKLMRLRVDQKKMLPDFLVFALGSRRVREQIEELGKTTAGQIGVSGADAKAFVIPVPLVEEQRRIVAYLDGLQAKVDALKKLQAETAAELNALLPSILDKAFKGEL